MNAATTQSHAGAPAARRLSRTRRTLSQVATGLGLLVLAAAGRTDHVADDVALVPPTVRVELPRGDIGSHQGKAFSFTLPAAWRSMASDTGAPLRSPLILREDGRRLGPGNAQHVTIRGDGGGAFSHWNGQLLFSTSDNTDPRSNGRVYSVELPGWMVGTAEPGLQLEPRTVSGRSVTYAVEVPEGTVRNAWIEITNVGGVDVESPWVVANGARDWFDLEAIAADVQAWAGPDAGDADKAEAVWRFLSAHRYHLRSGVNDIYDTALYLNGFGFGLCDDTARHFVYLSQAVGLQARLWRLGGHVVSEAYHDDAWHMYDADGEVAYLNEAGVIAGVEELSLAPELLENAVQVTGGEPGEYPRDMQASIREKVATRADNEPVAQPARAQSSMAFRLRPGESIVRLWQNVGLYARSEFSSKEPHEYGNGWWRSHWRELPDSRRLDYSIPYPIVGGTVRIALSPEARPTETDEAPESVSVAALLSGESRPLRSRSRTPEQLEFDVTGLFTDGWERPVREIEFQVDGPAEVVGAVDVELVFQLAPRALPALRSGPNAIAYRSASAEGRVRVTHAFVVE